MNKVIRKTIMTGAGLLLALTSGAPALADDTELLLAAPNRADLPTPNILFILDTSGSMGNEESTREIYDHTKEYGGDCNDNRLYWSETGTVPGCDSSNKKYISKDKFNCAAATRQIEGVGRFTDNMGQFRKGAKDLLDDLDIKRWQDLEIDNDGDIVECQRDSGKHGDGEDPDLVYARKGGGLDPYTSNPLLEVSWTSYPLGQAITVFDGNYLNYLQDPTFVNAERIQIVKDVTTAVLKSIENVNVGIMRFNDGDGGPVILGMTDLDTNRDDILATINGLDADGTTPFSETMYEAALYWRGQPAYFGERINEHPTDPKALVNPDPAPEVYKQPQTDVCAKNFNVLLTDGVPFEDFETPDLVKNLPNWGAIQGSDGCTGTEQGDCLDDIAHYLFADDISDDPGLQNVTTHTIGFSIDLEILESAARVSGGEYFLADDVQSLTIALLDIVTDITDRSLSFAAPAVAVNTFNRTQNLNDLYMTTFAARETLHWPGNLKKYRLLDGVIVDRYGVPAVDPDDGFFIEEATSFWSSPQDGNKVEAGGALENLPDPSVRTLYTDISAESDLTVAANALSPANVLSFEEADFGLTGSASEPSIEELIRWARGEDIRDDDNDPDTTVRKFMGDPLHSTPAAVVYGGTAASPDAVVYAATNDGYLHAIDAETGVELWAFVPREFLRNLSKLYFNPDAQYKNYGIDGDIVPVIKDVNDNGLVDAGDGDFVYIIFGMRRGANSYYLLDVTNKNRPILKWILDQEEFGQSWSRPTIARMNIDDGNLNDDQAVVVVGGGYDPAHDTMPHPETADTAGNGIYFIDLETGKELWSVGLDSADLELAEMTRAFPSQIRVVDINGDGFANRMYAADLGGQLWRFDIHPGEKGGNLVSGGVIAQLGAEGNEPASIEDTRRFYTSPDVSIFNDNLQNRRFVAISIGSGYRAHPLDTGNADRFYSIRDKDVFNTLTQDDYTNYDIVKDADLVEVSGTVGTVIGENDRGWKFTLPPDQKVLSTSVTFNNEIFFVAFSPDTASAASCETGRGHNFLYRVSVKNGDPIADLSEIAPGSEDDERVEELAQGGIAPSPRFLFPSPDADCTGEECSPPPLGCVGVECFDPGFENNPVRTLWTQDGVE